jgi:hypothetical protein
LFRGGNESEFVDFVAKSSLTSVSMSKNEAGVKRKVKKNQRLKAFE